MPPVSIKRIVWPFHSHSSSLRSLVTPGCSWTTASRPPQSRLISVDLPTFGKPTTATTPAIRRVSGASPEAIASSPRRCRARGGCLRSTIGVQGSEGTGRASRARAAHLLHAVDEASQPQQLLPDPLRALPVARRSPREPLERERLAEGDGHVTDAGRPQTIGAL